MNYFGRLVSNVRGFYSEINSATLTGAIDVVVVRREDGSFIGSPFHVRFGKLGVLRSREKIVDIEINGEPVELQMKLGEAGEAFFVEEIENDISDSLSTSPLPSAETLKDAKKDHRASCEVSGSNSTVSTENSHTTIQENAEKESCTTSISGKEQNADQEKESALSQETAGNDSGTDERTVDQAIKTENEKSKDDNHSDPETGELEESLLLSVKEPTGDFSDNRKISFGEVLSEPETTAEATLDGPSSKSDSIPIPVRRQVDPQDCLSDSETLWRDSSSSGFSREFYPLSDLDSPIGTPPNHSDAQVHHPPDPQRYLSDSEVELKQCQESFTRESEIRWAWGKLPQGPEGSFLPERMSADMIKEDIKHVHKSKRREASFKSHHKSGGQGILLDDLRTVDHEVAALYLHQALDSKLQQQQQQQSGSGSDDRESGLGQSLPCSPTVEEGSKDSSIGEYHDIAMSLCGDLKNGKVPLESFIKSMVTYDDLSNNPALLSDPKLVIRINDRYYNWQIAAPMLMSHVVFQRPLKPEACQTLVKQHMPKKEKRRSYRNMYYWFSWRANEEKSSDEENDDIKKDKPRPRVHSSTARKQLSIQESKIQDENESRERTTSECISGNESDFPKGKYRKVTRLSSDQIKSLNLKEGANSITFSVTTKYQGTAMCMATIYLWNHNDKIVISDIDGTITKSDVLGQILPVVGQAWAQSGVAHFFCKIQQNGYKVLYLSARAIGQAQQTRDYLKSVKQDQIMLPDGPLLLNPESLIKAFHREVIEKKPQEFKIACLRDIQRLFPTNKNPFYAGFGNKGSDVLSYRAVGISVSRIFTINHRGEVRHDLTNAFQTSYIKLSDLVDQMFPPFKTKGHPPSGLIAPDQFSSFTYWRAPLPDITVDDLDDVGDDKNEGTSSKQ
ncbi:phosphatidate phosphatase LPIN3-like isoform X1 [Porites lutea]|uniref:phosphatidate phosphatase LPIN3-like isoform X1 n=1 Tax=Porites lutea TaxID=51062 RepID=UPI003CC67359